jgi:hypothetical protein
MYYSPGKGKLAIVIPRVYVFSMDIVDWAVEGLYYPWFSVHKIVGLFRISSTGGGPFRRYRSVAHPRRGRKVGRVRGW